MIIRETLILCVFIATLSSCQYFTSSDKEKESKKVYQSIDDFILENHSILDTSEIDINSDGIKDIILVQKNIKEEELGSSENHIPRPLMILIRAVNGDLELVKRNDHAVFCFHCGGMLGDPYQGIVASDNGFTIYHYGGSSWRWEHAVVFAYDKKSNDWICKELESVSYNVSSPDSTTVEERQVDNITKFEDFDIYANSDGE